ncbi:MAG: acyl-CoA dehydrogenase family protein [Betaproteobacteria bacterium]
MERAEHQTSIVDLSQAQVGQRWRSGARTLNEDELGLACMPSNDPHPIHADARDGRAFRIGEGTSEMQRLQIARHLLAG